MPSTGDRTLAVLRQVNAMMTKDEARPCLRRELRLRKLPKPMAARRPWVALLGVDEFSGEGCLIGQPKRLAVAVTVSECTIMRREE